MEVHGYTRTNHIDATIDGVRMAVPDDMGNRHRQMIAEWEAAGNTIPAYEPPSATEGPLALTQVACARLIAQDWDVTGIERSSGLSLAFVADVDTVWAFFDEPQPDTYYDVTPADGVTKHTDYLEIVRPGLGAINLVVSRVQ